jgi:TPR repeat protein
MKTKFSVPVYNGNSLVLNSSMNLTEALKDYQAGRFDSALNLLKPLAEQGNPEAQSMLGSLYQLGLGTAVNRGEAVRWYRAASAQGVGVASNNLAGLLELDAQHSEAERLYELARRQGFAHSPQKTAPEGAELPA